MALTEQDIEEMPGSMVNVTVASIFYGIDTKHIKKFRDKLYILSTEISKITRKTYKTEAKTIRRAYVDLPNFCENRYASMLFKFVSPIVPIQIVVFKNKTTCKIGKWQTTGKHYTPTITKTILKWKLLK